MESVIANYQQMFKDAVMEKLTYRILTKAPGTVGQLLGIAKGRNRLYRRETKAETEAFHHP